MLKFLTVLIVAGAIAYTLARLYERHRARLERIQPITRARSAQDALQCTRAPNKYMDTTQTETRLQRGTGAYSAIAAERERKKHIALKKERETARAAADKYQWELYYLERLEALADEIQSQIDDNPNLKAYERISLEKRALQLEKAIRAHAEQRDKAFFTAFKLYADDLER